MSLLCMQVNLGETLLDAETVEKVETPVNCFRKLFGDLNKLHFASFPFIKASKPCTYCFFCFQSAMFFHWS